MPISFARDSMSASSVGRNSCSGGSRRRIVMGLSSITSYMPLKSSFCIGRSSARYFSLVSLSFERIMRRTDGILSSSKNICSVRHRPIPSAPNSRACFASLGESAFVLTSIVRQKSAHSMILPKLPESSGAFVLIEPSYTLPVEPSSEIKSPSTYVLPFARSVFASSSTTMSSTPATQHVPMPRATTAA